MKKPLFNYKIKGIRQPMISDKGVVLDNKLFFAVKYDKGGFYESQLIAVDLDTGSENIILVVPHLIRNTVLFDNEYLYINSFNAILYCIDYIDLSIKWECKFGDRNPDWHIGVTDKNILAFNGELFNIDKSTGNVLWTYQHPSNHSSCHILVKDDFIYHGLSDGYFYCFDLIKQKIKWTFGENLYFKSAAFLLDTLIIVCATNGVVYVLESSSGREIANFDTGDAIYREPIIKDNKIFIGNDFGMVYCLEFVTEKSKINKIWEYKASDTISSRVVILNSFVYLSSEDNYFYKLDMTSGDEIFKEKVVSYARDILFTGDKMILLSDKGQVDCYSAV